MLVLVLVLIHLSGLQLSAAIQHGQQATAHMQVDLRLAQAERALASSAAWYSMRLQAGETLFATASGVDLPGELSILPMTIPAGFLLSADWQALPCPLWLTSETVERCVQLNLTLGHEQHPLQRRLRVGFAWDADEQLRVTWSMRGRE